MSGAIRIVAILVLVALAGCTDQDQDVDISHVHGIAYSGQAVYLATHHGLAKGERGDPWTWSYVGDRYDFMGFTQDARNPGVFYSSGHPDDPMAFGGTNLGLLRSTDGGGNWEQRSLKGQADFHFLTSFAEHALAGYQSGQILVSTDGGSRWTAHPAPGQVTALAASDGRTLAGTTDGLFETLDFEEWEEIETDLSTISSLAVFGDFILAGTGDGQTGAAYRSLDGGASWMEMAQKLRSSLPVVFAIDPDDPEHAFASTSGASVMESRDQGKTWETVRPA